MQNCKTFDQIWYILTHVTQSYYRHAIYVKYQVSTHNALLTNQRHLSEYKITFKSKSKMNYLFEIVFGMHRHNLPAFSDWIFIKRNIKNLGSHHIHEITPFKKKLRWGDSHLPRVGRSTGSPSSCRTQTRTVSCEPCLVWRVEALWEVCHSVNTHLQ